MALKLTESRLYRELQSKDPSLTESLLSCWEEAEKLLRHTAATNPSHTSHGPDHALALVGILDQALVPILTNLNFSSDELYILLSATLLHDIGMVGAVDCTDSHRNLMRREHHIRTYTYIRNKCQELKLKREFINMIADVAAAHRKFDIKRDIKEYPVGYASQKSPRAQLCAALLRLADECHITADRVPHDYGILNLTSSSTYHFQSHLETIGRIFDPIKGTITFTIEIKTSLIDQFFKEVQKKFKKELKGLQNIFNKHGIPYHNVIWIENRDDLIRQKVILAILKKGTCFLKDFTQEIGEKRKDVESFLRKFGSYSPFVETKQKRNVFYTLKEDQSTFDELSDYFLLKLQDNDEPLTFIRSVFCKKILTDEFLDQFIEDALDNAQDRLVAFLIIRNSPSALQYVIQNKERLTKRNILGGGGLLRSLIGELENDFQKFPELLLEPALLDEVFAEGERDRDKWDKWRIFQIYQYHTAFEEQKIFDQWVIPNIWEQKANPAYQDAGHNFTWQISCPEEQFYHPGLLFAASKRLGVELKIENSKSITMSLQADFGPDELKDGVKIKSTIFNPPRNINNPYSAIPCHFYLSEDNNYFFEILEDSYLKGENWKSPITLKLRFMSPSEEENKGKQVNFTFNLNKDLLDCEQAALLLKAADNSKANFFIKGLPGVEKALDRPSDNLHGFFSMGFDSTEKAFIIRLGKIQRAIGQRIPFPFFGWPKSIEDTIFNSQINTKEEAEVVWKRVLNIIEGLGKRTVSPLIAEIHHDEYVTDRMLLDVYYGIHQPRMCLNLENSSSKDPHYMVDEILDNPNERTVMRCAINLSPEAAIQFLKENPCEAKEQKKIHPGMLHKAIPQSAVENRTKMQCYWEPAVDYSWYEVTLCRCTFTPFRDYERWLIESEYFIREKNDLSRAYLAAKNAFRCAPEEPETCIQFGWVAFLVNRTDEALKVTSKVEDLKNPFNNFIANINIGLFRLKLALIENEKRNNHLKQAEKSYERAIGFLQMLDREKASEAIEMAINDITQQITSLDSKAKEFLKKFEEVHNIMPKFSLDAPKETS